MNINIEKINTDKDELIIRTGEAEIIRYDVPINISGNIFSPGKYVEKRKDSELSNKIHPDKCLVTVARRAMMITFQENPNNQFAATITGRLIINPDIKLCEINGVTFHDITSLIKHLKDKRRFFKNPDQHTEFLKNLNDFKININTDLERKQDNSGNYKSVVEKRAKTDMPKEFILKMPIFEGMPDAEFKVELCFITRDMAVEFWFESLELFDLLKKDNDAIIDNELKAFQDYVIIEL